MRRSHRKPRGKGSPTPVQQMDYIADLKGSSKSPLLAPAAFFIIGMIFIPSINKIMDLVPSMDVHNLKSTQAKSDNHNAQTTMIVESEQTFEENETVQSLNQIFQDNSIHHEEAGEDISNVSATLKRIENQLQQNILYMNDGKNGELSDELDKHAHIDEVKTDRQFPEDVILTELNNFRPTILSKLTPKEITLGGRKIKPVELRPTRPVNTQIRVYIYEDFLSQDECDSLIRVHRRHIDESPHPPLLCFDSINTLQHHLVENGEENLDVTSEDFIEGTRCINSSLSQQLTELLSSNWSYSTAFYPGESRFSEVFEQRVAAATGLSTSNGGKFQLTSYPIGKGYKTHTDCTVGSLDKRDRAATILVYLQDVHAGGETEFPELGISVKPKRGRALVWMNMNEHGECDPTSVHRASQVRKGHKYILQRWYYHQSFYFLGKRPAEPRIPPREPKQPRVTCDEYRNGSCRWYDEWDYDHISEYRRHKHGLL